MRSRRMMMTVAVVVGIMLGAQSYAQSLFSKELPLEQVFVPKGFDDNDISQIVVSGYLPDMCHSFSGIKVKRSGKDIFVKAYAKRGTKILTACPTITVPFAEVVNLGHLEKGDYSIHFSDSESTHINRLNVSDAPSFYRDSYFYAQVNDIAISDDLQTVSLNMTLPSSCVDFDGIQAVYNGSDVMSLLPVMEFDGESCVPEARTITRDFEIPVDVFRRPLLIHTRSINGNSLNQVITDHMSYRVN